MLNSHTPIAVQDYVIQKVSGSVTHGTKYCKDNHQPAAKLEAALMIILLLVFSFNTMQVHGGKQALSITWNERLTSE